MKIITWNCKMKFREDLQEVFPLKPDLLVISECENIDRLNLPREGLPEPSDAFWIGDNQSKGLGVFTFNGYKLELYENYSDEFKYILPLILSKEKEEFNLMGIWTKKVGDKKQGHNNYIRQVYLANIAYQEFLENENVIICGDFNSNLIWERTGVDKNHQDVLDQLSKKGIFSSYHHFFDEEQGKETQPTYYHYHKKDRPFHIDFCFLSKPLIEKLKLVSLGDFNSWIELSDHVPMTIEF